MPLHEVGNSGIVCPSLPLCAATRLPKARAYIVQLERIMVVFLVYTCPLITSALKTG